MKETSNKIIAILKYSLDGYEPRVCVSQFGNDWKGNAGYLATHTVAVNFPEMRWDITGTLESALETAAEDLQKLGFKTEIVTNSVGIKNIDAVHIPTAEAQEALKNKIAERRKTGEKGFLRFGNIPKNGRSYNFRDNFYENGVSVYNALFYPNGEYEIIPKNNIQLLGSINYSTRPAFRVWGEITGTGSDGEPVLKNILKLKKI